MLRGGYVDKLLCQKLRHPCMERTLVRLQVRCMSREGLGHLGVKETEYSQPAASNGGCFDMGWKLEHRQPTRVLLRRHARLYEAIVPAWVLCASAHLSGAGSMRSTGHSGCLLC